MSNFLPVKSKSGNHQGYRIEADGTLTIKFKGGAYNYPEIPVEHQNEYIRRAGLEGDDNSNGKYFHLNKEAFRKANKL